MSVRAVLLGPQSGAGDLAPILDELELDGPLATITAGWQEWEADDDWLASESGRELKNLELYARADRIWAADPELREAHRAMQADLRLLQTLYRRQLSLAADSWMELLDTEGPERVVGPEREAALQVIRDLDERHLSRIAELRAEFGERMRVHERDAVARERADLQRILVDMPAVLLEGGHAAVLLNRIRLFGLRDALAERVVLGRSAGAMALCERVVLYHDAPAIGRGHAEVGMDGLGLVPGIVALPDASHRLRLEEPTRMRRLSLRVAPLRCAVLDRGDRAVWDGVGLSGPGRVVASDGTLVSWEHAA
jgi:hypothetical protein